MEVNITQQLKAIIETDFKGYNDKDKPENLPGTGYMADLLNCFIEENKIIKRTGYDEVGTDVEVEKPILGQARHEPSGGTKYLLRARDDATSTNAVVEGNSGAGAWAALTGADSQTAGADHEFAMAENATYIFDGTDTVLKTTNGTSTSTVAAIPKGQDGKWWHNFFFVFGVSGNMSRLYFSDVNAPETFDAVNGFIDINTDDNENITGLGAMKDQLFIFKPTKVFQLTGYGTSDFTLGDLSDFGVGTGTVSRRSIVETGNDVYFIHFRGKTPHFRSIQRTVHDALVDGGIISDDITGTMDGLVVGRLNQTAGIFDGRKVWWSVVDSGTANNLVLVYDPLVKGWTRHTGINASVFNISTVGGSIELYFGESGNNALTYILDTSTSDNDEAIDFQVKTPLYNPVPAVKCRYKYLYMTGDVEADIDIDVDNSPDGFTFGDLGTISLTSQGAAFGTAIFGTSKFGATTLSRQRLDFAGGNANYMQYRFRNNAADEDVTIREWELFFKPKRLRAIAGGG